MAISLLHHTLRDRQSGRGYWRRRLLEQVGDRFYTGTADELLNAWLRVLAEAEGSRAWHVYHADWLGVLESSSITLCRYEDLLADPVGELLRVAEVMGFDRDEDRAAAAVKRFDFKLVTGRNRGQEDPRSFLRSGATGTWRNIEELAESISNQPAQRKVAAQLGYSVTLPSRVNRPGSGGGSTKPGAVQVHSPPSTKV